MESLFINSNFHYVRVVPVKNGITWTVDALCYQISTLYKALDVIADKIIVWVDREGREESAQEINAQLELTLVNAGARPENICILVCDRMTENVLLADETLIQNEFSDCNYRFCSFGTNGKKILKQLYINNNLKYKEMIQGVKLLKKFRLRRAALNNCQIDTFLNRINIDCWWTSQSTAD